MVLSAFPVLAGQRRSDCHPPMGELAHTRLRTGTDWSLGPGPRSATNPSKALTGQGTHPQGLCPPDLLPSRSPVFSVDTE